VRRAGAVGGEANRLGWVRGVEKRHGYQAHKGAVPPGLRVGRAGVGLTRALEPAERAGDGDPDVEAAPVRAQVPLAPPADVALHLVARVEAAALEEALG
jgi:hypothetical protein